MSMVLVWWLLAAIVVGSALAWLGHRGRRINDHPTCRQCRFDLSGSPGPGDGPPTTCPECGCGLRRPGWVVVGQRRRSPIAIALGLALVALPIAILASVGVAMVGGVNLNAHKPVRLLAWESRRARGETLRLIGAELLARAQNARLGPAELKEAAAAALDVQADRSRPWDAVWGDVIAEARAAGALSQEDDDRFKANLVVLDFAVRPRVRVGSPVPITVKVKEKRIGTQDTYSVAVNASRVMLGGDEVLPPLTLSHNPGLAFESVWMNNPRLLGHLMVVGGSGPWGGMMPTSVAGRVAMPASVAPGFHRFQFEALHVASQMSTMGSSGAPEARDTQLGRHAAAMELVLVPSSERTVEVVAASPQLEEEFTRLMPPVASAYEQPSGFAVAGINFGGKMTTIQLQFPLDAAPAPLCHRVVLRYTKKREAKRVEVRLGPLVSGTLSRGFDIREDAEFPLFAGNEKGSVVGHLSGFDADTVDIILKPDPELAERTIDLTRMYGGTIVYRGVSIRPDTLMGNPVVSVTGVVTGQPEDATSKPEPPERAPTNEPRPASDPATWVVPFAPARQPR